MGRPKRQLTEAEKAICREVGKTITCAEARKRLRVSHAVLKRHVTVRPIWSPEKEDILRTHHSVPIHTLMRLTGMSRSQIHRKKLALGLTLPRKWAGTDQWLRDNIGTLGVKGIAKALDRRSLGALRTHLWRLGICPGEHSDVMSLRLVCDFLNVNETTVVRWGIKRDERGIDPKDLRDFIVRNPLKIDPRKVPGESWPTLVQLLAKRW